MGFVIRTNAAENGADCVYDNTNDYLDRYVSLSGAGGTCKTYKWATKLGETGEKTTKANWVAQSTDNNYFIVVGIDTQSGANMSQMAIWKINAADGAVVWKMNYGTAGTNTGLESVAVLSDGSFIVGGYTDGEDSFWPFKSTG